MALDHNSFRKDTVIGEKRLDLGQLLSHYNGRCNNLELTLDLMSDNKQSDSPSKTGELITVFNGLNIEGIASNHSSNQGKYIYSCVLLPGLGLLIAGW